MPLQKPHVTSSARLEAAEPLVRLAGSGALIARSSGHGNVNG